MSDAAPRRYSLLVVDDNEMNRDLLTRRLEQLGYVVAAVSGGREALERLQAENYDLVLLDIMMPEVDGFQVLERLRESGVSKRIPIMMVTAVNDMENVKRCVTLGARDYIAKPFDPVLLKARVAKLIEKYSPATGNECSTASAAGQPSASASVSLRQRVAVEVRKKMLSNTLELPVVSDVATTITQLTRVDVPISEVTKVVTLDAALTAKLISIANSNFYRGLSKVEKVDDAITRLGLNETKRYVLTMVNKQAYRGGRSLTARYAEETWQHALAVAQAARALAEQCKLGDPGRFYTLGLIHDIGVAVVLKAIDDIPGAADEATRELIQELVDELHHEAGGYLARRWMFPEAFESAVAEHHSAERNLGSREAQVLVVAEAVAASLGVINGEPTVPDMRVVRARELLGVGDEQLAAIAATTAAQLKEIKTVM